jgi:hypothetical protein
MTTEPRILTDFEGDWALERRISNRDGASGQFIGQARWQPHGAGLQYIETGQLRLQGHAAMQAERRYWWDADLSVYFEDGRFFHRVPACGGDTAHWCDPDQYRGTYGFADWPVFEVTWRVSGPRKAYHMISLYRRV